MEPKRTQTAPASQEPTTLVEAEKWLPLVPILGGLLFLAHLSLSIRPHIHFSGDGALKEYLLRLWMEGHLLSNRVPWEESPKWVQTMWIRYIYPFGKPFVFENKIIFPPFFLAATFPFYAAAGYYGLYVLPLASMAGLWFVVWTILRDEGLTGFPVFVALVVLVSSPLTFYGMMFWEHAPALFCFFLAYRLMMKSPSGIELALAGMLLIASFALRPELAVAVALLLGYGALRVRPWKPFFIGALLMFFIWCGINTLATGSPFGIHGKQPLMLSGGGVFDKLLSYAVFVGGQFTHLAPDAGVALLIGGTVFIHQRNFRSRDGLLLLIALGTFALLPFMIPNNGGLQIFSRFHFVMLVGGALMAAHLARFNLWFGFALLLICPLKTRSMLEADGRFRWSYEDRVRTIQEYIHSTRPAAIFADNVFVSIEFAQSLPDIPILQSSSSPIVESMIRDAAPYVNIDRAILVIVNKPLLRVFPIRLKDGSRIEAIPIPNQPSIFSLYQLKRIKAPAPRPR